MHVVSMGHGYKRQSRERKGGDGIMSEKWWVGYMVYGLDGREVWQPIGLTSPTPHLWFMPFNFFGISLHFLIVIAL